MQFLPLEAIVAGFGAPQRTSYEPRVKGENSVLKCLLCHKAA
jgi:hypothetical protein